MFDRKNIKIYNSLTNQLEEFKPTILMAAKNYAPYMICKYLQEKQYFHLGY